MTDLLSDIAPVLSTPDFVVRPLIPVTLDLPLPSGKRKYIFLLPLSLQIFLVKTNAHYDHSNLENRQFFD